MTLEDEYAAMLAKERPVRYAESFFRSIVFLIMRDLSRRDFIDRR